MILRNELKNIQQRTDMKKRFINPTATYVRGGAVTVSCTLEVLADDGVTVVASTGLTYTADIGRHDFRELVNADLARQAQDYIDQLKVVVGMVAGHFGVADFDAAVGMIMADVDGLVEV